MSENENEAVETETEVKQPGVAKKAVGITKDAAIVLVADANPKRPGSSAYDRFEGYFKPMNTVQDALDNGLTMGDIKYDLIHGFIEVDGASVEEYTVTIRGARGTKKAVDEDLMNTGESAGMLVDDDEDVLA